MSETDESAPADDAAPRSKSGLMTWILTALVAIATAGGGFAAARMGVADRLLAGGSDVEEHGEHLPDLPQFLELEPIVISVGDARSVRQLRFRAFLEVAPDAPTDVAALQPRILDVFAAYLRAVPIEQLEDPTALLRLRAQMLRRVQLLAGPDAVGDLLIIDFVIT
ncbi:flagellar basal body-associated FliL family protein [Jannaschia sp. S6380]|uniref:flagellar basal body-associated FliL family protein n=1 Tax=Jannaschia sp. S6380 TaxID=2926408 RepID=UPI001FF3E3A4|nr:flagellar basal body-associated FliL family protein [Jannaschia sp. S6380]MCK0168248.1 flagellar basal body-associated FliL family protein [Jannaschia sp. S6380]